MSVAWQPARNPRRKPSIFCAAGCRKKDAASFQKDIENDTNLFCFIEDDANNVLRQPPTKLKNPKIFRPFEMYVKMYGLPNYNEIDPTIIVGLTYAFIFGIMFADVGQGLCLLIGGALLYHYKKMDLAAIMSTCAVFSVIFGFLFGSFFGFENVIPALWLHPKEAMTTLPFIGSMNTVFVAAVAFGMFMILTGMVLHMINAARNHKLGELLFSQNSLAGFIFYGALAVTLVLLFSGHKAPAVGVMVVMFGIPLLAIFLKEPLERMVEKKGNAFPETGKGMFFVQAFFELFDVLFELLLQHNFLCPCRRICSQPCGYDGGCPDARRSNRRRQHQLAGYCSRKHLRCLP